MSTYIEPGSSLRPATDGADVGPLLVASARGGGGVRIASGVGGAALLLAGLRGRTGLLGKLAIAAGLDLSVHAASGRATLVTRALSGSVEPTRLESSIVVERPPAVVYAFWNNERNLPRVLKNVESVSIITGDRTHWTASGPLGIPLTWEATPIANVPNERLAWRSLDGGSLANAGELRLTPIDDGKATLVRLVVEYEMPLGRIGGLIASLFGRNPAQTLDGDLERLKDVVEGETAAA